MQKLLLAAVLALPVTPAFADLTLTGDRGGTITKTRDCVRADAQATCTVGTTYTSPDGTTAQKSRDRVTSRGQSETTVTLTGPNGTSKTRKRLLLWGK